MPNSALNPEQLSAVSAPTTPLLVLAGAGAGKTRVVASRILHLIKEEGIAPREILAVTFTNKAANELKERVLHQCPNTHADDAPMVCTFHSLGVFILRRSLHLLRGERAFVIYDQGESEKVLKQCLQKYNTNKNSYKEFRTQISLAKNRLLLPEHLKLSDPLQPIYQEYQQRLQEAQALDFDDLLLLPIQLFHKFPEVREEYSTLWKALLIDEYQDTNHAQYTLSQALAHKHRNIFVVGDPDQSIYSWRGANMRNILNFADDYPDARVIRLEKNYRSHANILNAANHLIQHNINRLDKNLVSVKGPGEKIRCIQTQNDKQEAEFVAREIDRLRNQISLRDMCIFYRTNFQSRAFEDALLRKRIPYKIIGGLSFYKRKEIQDILAFLKLIVNPHDLIAFDRIINLPKRGLGPTTITALIEYALHHSLPILKACEHALASSVVKLSKKQKEGLQEFIHIFQQFEQLHSTSSLSEFIYHIIQTSGYRKALQEDPDTCKEREDNLSELISKTLEWEAQNPEGALEAFLDDLALRSSVEEETTTTDCIHLMTLHSGKGLEFRVAFIVGLENGLFPSQEDLNEIKNKKYENLEEERRLCYVGITRAKELLCLTYARQRLLWGSIRSMTPSIFLKELPRDYVIHASY